MALVDVVKCNINDRELVYKFPSDDLRLGTQLVVYPGQTAFFVKGGQIFDEFEAGTYTLKTSNIPLLNRLVNLPFGGDTPFKAEVWFVNQIAKLDSKWGTATPLQIEDPKYEVIVPVRAYGQYGFRIDNPRLFLETLIGNMTSFSAEKLNRYFKGNILFYSHDYETVNTVANRIIELLPNGGMLDFSGTYEQFIEYKREKGLL